jgi:hypothetical protein
MVADAAGSVEPALDHGLGTNEYRVTDFHGFGMLENYFGLDAHSVSRLPAHRAKENASELCLERPFLTTVL